MGLQDVWMARAAAFELMSKVLLLTDRQTAQAVVDGSFALACRETLTALGCPDEEVHSVACILDSWKGKSPDGVFHVMRREYTRLFVGVREPLITPYMGIWAAEQRGHRGVLFMGPESRDIEAFMIRCGVAKNLARGQSNDPVDHLGTMCEFLMVLSLIKARAMCPPPGSYIVPEDFDDFFARFFRDFVLDRAAEIKRLSAIEPFVVAARMLELVVEEVSTKQCEAA